jgi:hypothetical protein
MAHGPYSPVKLRIEPGAYTFPMPTNAIFGNFDSPLFCAFLFLV